MSLSRSEVDNERMLGNAYVGSIGCGCLGSVIGYAVLILILYCVGLDGLASFLWRIVTGLLGILWEKIPGICCIVVAIPVLIVVIFLVVDANERDKQKEREHRRTKMQEKKAEDEQEKMKRENKEEELYESYGVDYVE